MIMKLCLHAIICFAICCSVCDAVESKPSTNPVRGFDLGPFERWFRDFGDPPTEAAIRDLVSVAQGANASGRELSWAGIVAGAREGKALKLDKLAPSFLERAAEKGDGIGLA